MKGDYKRYIAETAVEVDVRQDAPEAKEAKHLYEQAKQKSKDAGLGPTSPIVLSLALNHSVFLSEIMMMDAEATLRAYDAYKNAIDQLPSIDQEGEDKEESLMIIQCLNDNITAWKKKKEAEMRANQ